MFEIKRYEPSHEQAWNDFVARSKNGTFLFDRRFMDYHSDRFADSSLMILRKGRIYALLPANRVGDTLHSHQGLTYGGLLTDAKATAEGVMEAFGTLNAWLRNEGVRRVTYKAMPWIYHRLPAEEDLYALTQVCHARLLTREISSTILLQQPLRFTESRKSGLRKALREGLYMEESGDLAAFWQMLDDNLASRHHTHPVHSLDELRLLQGRFSQQIHLYLIYNKEKEPVGGTWVFDTGPHAIYRLDEGGKSAWCTRPALRRTDQPSLSRGYLSRLRQIDRGGRTCAQRASDIPKRRIRRTRRLLRHLRVGTITD